MLHIATYHCFRLGRNQVSPTALKLYTYTSVVPDFYPLFANFNVL